jgi:hypothetical protein
MRRHSYSFVAAATAIGLLAAACGNSSHSGTTTTAPTATGTATTTSPAATTSGGTDLQSLIPSPANTQRTDGPNSVQENGIHTHFLVNGSPNQAMDSYKTALEGKGWSLTVNDSGGFGATYAGTNGNVYGVFTGGGYGATTDIDACAWPSKPSDTHCGHD